MALGVSFFFLYTRKKEWMKPSFVWLICIGLLLVGVFGFLNSEYESRNKLIMFYGFCVPVIYWTFDRIFKKISLKMHKRDFILYLRYSDEINDQLNGKNQHVKSSDKLFSFGLLIIILGSLLIGIGII